MIRGAFLEQVNNDEYVARVLKGDSSAGGGGKKEKPPTGGKERKDRESSADRRKKKDKDVNNFNVIFNENDCLPIFLMKSFS